MSSTIAAILTVAILTGWHLRTRRHPCWAASADGRFYIFAGYPMVAIAVFWLVEATTATGWEWAIGNLWALAAMISFVYGFNALHRTHEEHQHASQAIESIDPTADEAGPASDRKPNGSSHRLSSPALTSAPMDHPRAQQIPRRR